MIITNNNNNNDNCNKTFFTIHVVFKAKAITIMNKVLKFSRIYAAPSILIQNFAQKSRVKTNF